MTRLVVQLLGGFRVGLGGAPVYDFEADKVRALLAYLIVEADRPHRRETLASLLWPDRPDAVARKSLRQALFRLRQALRDHEPPYFIFASPTDIQFNVASDYTLDVAELEVYSRPAARLELLPAELCADFLAGFSVPDSEPFQAWALGRQERYHQLALEILDRQNATFEAAGDYEQAIAAARLQLQVEPWLEEAHRQCIRGLALAGRRDEALRQYDACCRALADELGVEPAAVTTELVADIRAGRGGPRAHPASPAPGQRAPQQPAPGQPQGLPLLVAREDELGRLGGHLERALVGETGVVFVSGDAGSGKTALLEAFAVLAMAKHPDLLVASARCNPDGSLNPFAPLRRVAEMLFGDLRSEVAWRVQGTDQLHRLQAATGLTLASLDEYGPDLPATLVPAASVARRAESAKTTVGATAGRPASPARPAPPRHDALTQDVLFDQLVCTLAAIARERPLFLLFDDLHWVDDATAAFLVHLGRELGGTCPAPSRLLVLGAYRTSTVALGRRDPGSGATLRHPLSATVNELSRIKGDIVVELDRADGRAFVEALVDTEPNRLGAHFRDALYAQTGGHALFTVETLRNLQARGELFKDEAGRWVARESLDWGSLPAKVEAAIAERIDRLPEAERRILSTASVQGDDFAGELVAELTGMPVHEVLTRLSTSLARQHALVRAEGVVRAEGLQRVRSVYRFTHHLFQKYLYDQLDPVERAQLHGGIAASLDREAGADPAERERLSARLAWHYEAGGYPMQAARALHDAGRQALRLSAFREALERFDHGLALLANAPPSDERASGERTSAERAEVERLLQIARLNPQRNLAGLGGADMQGALDRAAGALAGNEMGRPALTILLGQATLLLAGGQHDESLPVFERLYDQAARCGDHVFVALAHLGLGALCHANGQLRESERHLEWVRGWLSPERAAEMRAAAAVDASAITLAFSAINRWCLGYPEAALALCKRALTGAISQGDTYGQAYSTAIGSLLLLLVQDEGALQELSEQCYRLSLQQGFAWWRSFAEVFLGRRMVLAGKDAAGLERMRNGVAGWRRAGLAFGSATLAFVMADTCLLAAGRRPPGGYGARGGERRDGLLASGIAAIDAAIGPGKAWPSQVFPCELCRLRGELLLARDGLAAAHDALACFERAMGLARERDLLALELRAAMSVVRLRRCQGEAYAAELDAARGYLRELYGRFTEGFAFPDLRDAAALLGATDVSPHVSDDFAPPPIPPPV